jgi:hypothetical protein
MLMRLIDFLKAGQITAFMTTLTHAAASWSAPRPRSPP